MVSMSQIARRTGLLAAFAAVAVLTLSPIVKAQDAEDEPPAGPNPWIAGGLSLLVPGLGQVYTGDPPRALLIAGGAVALIAGKLIVASLLPPKAPAPTTPMPAASGPPRAPLEALDLVFTLALPTYWAWNVGDAVGLAMPSPSPSPSPSPGAPPGLPPTIR